MSDDEIGYGKPPKHSRFAKGQSGNPKGRPKGAKNIKTALEYELKAKVTLKEGDKVKTVTKTQAFAKTVVNKALSGDPRAAHILIALIKEFQLLNEDEKNALSLLSEEDLAVLGHHGNFLKFFEDHKDGK